jgi:hypothetical protein
MVPSDLAISSSLVSDTLVLEHPHLRGHDLYLCQTTPIVFLVPLHQPRTPFSPPYHTLYPFPAFTPNHHHVPSQ